MVFCWFFASFSFGQEINGNGIDDDGDCNVDCDDLEFGVQATEFVTNMAASFVVGQPDFISNAAGLNANKFDGPYDVAVDPVSGKLFVSEIFNSRILRYASFDHFLYGVEPEIVLGQTDFTTGSTGLAADKLDYVTGIFVDGSGILWACDWGNNRVLRYDDAANKLTGASADGVLGQPDFTSNIGVMTRTGMDTPVDVVVDDFGRLYVAEEGNGRVLRFDNAAAKSNGANADGVLGSSNYTTWNNSVTNINLSVAGGLAFVCNALYVSDETAHRILRWDNPASLANGAAADAVLGQSNFSNSANATSQNGLSTPRFLSADSNHNLYVGDSSNDRVLIFKEANAKSNGANADIVIGQADFTTATTGLADNRFNTPRGILLVENLYQNYLVVGDAHNNRFLVFGQNDLQTDEFTSVNADLIGLDASGSGGFSFAMGIQPAHGLVVIDNPSTGAFTYTPSGICPLDEDYVDSFTYTITNANGCSQTGGMKVLVQEVAPCMEILGNGIDDDGDCNVDCDDLSFGTGQYEFVNGRDATFVVGQNGFFTNSSGSTESKLNSPNDVAMDPVTKKVFVCDTGNNRILRYSSMDDFIQNKPAEAVIGQTNFTNNSPGSSFAKLRYPTGITVDNTGILWIADWGNHRVVRFDNASNIGNNAFADGLLGQLSYTNGTSGFSATRMNQPVDLVVDEFGNLYVAEDANGRVLRFDNASAKAVGAPADAVLGATDFTSNTNNTDRVNIKNALGLVLVCNSLYVSDADNHRVLRWDNPSGLANGALADGVLGQADFVSNSAGLSNSTFNTPRFLATDSENNLFVTDASNHRVLLFKEVSDKVNGANAEVVLGQVNFNTGVGGLSKNSFQNPRGLYVLNDGLRSYLAVADEGNHRIMLFGDGILRTNETTSVSDKLAGYDMSGSGGLVFELVTQPSIGQITSINSVTGDFTYEPQGNCPYDTNVTTSFVYSISNNNGCKTYAGALVVISDVSPCIENCNNGLDDDMNGFVDELDPSCDMDGDGVVNGADMDIDNDGLLNSVESGSLVFCMETTSYLLGEDFGTGARGASLYIDACFESGANASCTYNGTSAIDFGEYSLLKSTDVASTGVVGWVNKGDASVDTEGRMAIFDIKSSGQVLYERVISGAVAGLPMSYAIRLLNLNPSGSNVVKPQVRIELLSLNRVPFYSNTLASVDDNAAWGYRGGTGVLADSSSFIFRVVSVKGGAIGNDLAIDNIFLTQQLKDCDGDGIANIFDLDSDNDGLPDLVEQNGVDTNGDGVSDNINGDGTLINDLDNNGADDAYQGLGLLDTDGDFKRDFVDLDSDNDGIYDVLEAGGVDLNFDGIIGSSAFVDTNNNGLGSIVDPTESGVPIPNRDSDNDGNPDAKEKDSDNDGCFDVKEAGFPDPDTNGLLGTGTIGTGLVVNGRGVVVP